MAQTQAYYYEDVGFQLDLNLHSIRRQLVELLEEYQQNGCISCDRLKCSCDGNISFTSSMSSNNYCYDVDRTTNTVYIKIPPPAHSLPTPEWATRSSTPKKSQKMSRVNAWMKASTTGVPNSKTTSQISNMILNQINSSWPPFPKSIWSDEKAKTASEKEKIYCSKSEEDSVCSVEEFFKHFAVQRKTTVKNLRDMPFYPRCSSPFEIMEDGSPHSLLEPPCPAYTNVTVRRAFIVWLHCGQRNKFKDVCNYYHYLESLEEKLPANKRATSRHHEFDMFTNQPPKSSYLNHYFPSLYSQTFEKQHINKVEAITNEKCVFKLEGFDEIRRQERTAKNEILHASRMIRNYCKSHNKTLRKFLEEFKEYTRKCDLNTSVSNVVFYIKRKLIEEELQTNLNCPKNFSFLNSSNDESDVSDVKIEKKSNSLDADMPEKLRTLFNEARKANKQTTSACTTINVLAQFIDKMANSHSVKYPVLNKNPTQAFLDSLTGVNVNNFPKKPEIKTKYSVFESFIQNMKNKNNIGHDLFHSQFIMKEMSKFRKI